MDINSIIYVDNSNHYIKSTDQDITCVQWCCEWFWLRYHPVAIWLVIAAVFVSWPGWWSHDTTCTALWIILHQIIKKLQRSVICSRSYIHGVRLVNDIIRIAIDEPTWSDGLHSWRSIDLIQSWSQSYLCFNRNRLIWVTDWQVNLSTAETMIKGGGLTIPILLLQLLVNSSNKYSTIYQLFIYISFVVFISADCAI